jgi:hypothetical protein
LRRLLEAHGFDVEATYGDWERSPLTADTREMVIVSRKR